MECYIVHKSKQQTGDGLFIYNFENIPQPGYIKIHNLFMENDKDAIKRAEKMVGKDVADFRILEG